MLTSPSGKSYIGQTIQPILKRLGRHQLQSSKCRAILGAINKYGWEKFEKDWYECPDEDLNFDEEMLVEEMGTLAPGGYNLKEGGGSSGKMCEETKKKISESQSGEKNHNYGKTLSDEIKKKISESQSGEKNHNYGKSLSEETKKKISKAQTGENAYWYGKTRTEETKKKMSKAQSGKTLSDDTKEKISKAQTGEKNHNYGKSLSEETKKKISKAKTGTNNPLSKKVHQYTIDGTYVDSFGSSGEAAQALGKSDGSLIRACVRGKRNTALGFKWSRVLN
jgi:group I intron endonuclease